MSELEAKKSLINRLRTIKGHIGGIEKMIEENKSCEEVLLQIVAVRSSVEKIGYLIIEDHAQDCLLKEGITQEEIQKVLKTILKFIK